MKEDHAHWVAGGFESQAREILGERLSKLSWQERPRSLASQLKRRLPYVKTEVIELQGCVPSRMRKNVVEYGVKFIYTPQAYETMSECNLEQAMLELIYATASRIRSGLDQHIKHEGGELLDWDMPAISRTEIDFTVRQEITAERPVISLAK